MSFYIPAKADDFEEFDVEYSNYWNMDDVTKELIEEGNIRHAMLAIRQQTGMGLAESRKYCLKYQSYVSAKDDFELGRPVFVPY